MRRFGVAFFVLIVAAAGHGQPTLTITKFLDTKEPQRMCQDYIDYEFGDTTILLLQPSGGAALRIDLGLKDRILYIFCDQPANRLVIFSLDDDGENRTPNGITAYGRELAPQIFSLSDGISSFNPPYMGQDSVGCFFGPVDIAVSSHDTYYDAVHDKIYVLDQGNQRVVRLRYDQSLDSLIWVDSFGSDILDLPTAITYADYCDSDIYNNDVYVTDGMLSKILRFSRDGVLEETYGSWGSSYGSIGYPTGIATSRIESLPDRFYVSDSKNHRVMRYRSGTSGPIMADGWYFFPLETKRYVKAVETDTYGNVYVADNFTHLITILSSDLHTVFGNYGGFGYDPGLFDHPYDMYIDKDELQVCERWGAQSGLQTFLIEPGEPKLKTEELPKRFFLYQNYPNPFNSNTIINFDLPEQGQTRLMVYNILGQLVTTLVDGTLQAGAHSVIWDGRNRSGNRVATGVYFYVVTSGQHQSSKKLLLLK